MSKCPLSQLLPLFYENAATASMTKMGWLYIAKFTLHRFRILDRFQSWLWMRHCMHWPNWFSGTGLIHMTRTSVYSCSVDSILKWLSGLRNNGIVYLEASGWITALTEAGIAPSGIILKASHLTRTRHAHQVSALALTTLQRDAFLGMVTEKPHYAQTKDDWRQDMITKCPTFMYWDP